ncbi:MAG: hypothetical protein ABWZ66_06945 [Pyrinomonadaceae bacterium]
MRAETENIKLDSFFARVLSNVDYSQPKPEIIREAETVSLISTLNRIVERGASFDVGADKFNTFGTVKDSDKDFLSINRDSILCTLQQSLLMKHLFNHSKSSFSDFASEIAEGESHLTATGMISSEAHFEAVREITQKWFTRLLDLI